MDKLHRILIVDDERYYLKVLSDLLHEDYKIMAAKDGESALRAAQGPNPPDLILLDTIMPGLDGYAVCKQLNCTIQCLQEARREIKKIGGLIPICAHCKKIRNDKGYWNTIESYIRDHSEAEFSHGICQECAKNISLIWTAMTNDCAHDFVIPNDKYSQASFLMNTIRNHEDGRNQQFMQEWLTLPLSFLAISGRSPKQNSVVETPLPDFPLIDHLDFSHSRKNLNINNMLFTALQINGI